MPTVKWELEGSKSCFNCLLYQLETDTCSLNYELEVNSWKRPEKCIDELGE